MQPPRLVVFDVNGTLSDLGPLARRCAEVGAPEHLARLWFTSVLRDGFALTAAGTTERFVTLADEALRVLLAECTLDRPVEAAAEHVMAGFAEVPAHPDVPAGVRALGRAGLRLVTLTNGSVEITDRLLRRAGVRDAFESLMSVEEAGVWKPSPEAYRYALRRCDVRADEAMLVAVHPWDVDGAARAGLRTAWLSRDGGRYPGYLRPAEVTVTTLPDLPAAVGPAGQVTQR